MFLPAEENQTYEGINIVHPRLQRQELFTSVFHVLGIAEVDATSELKSLLATGPLTGFSDEQWQRLWNLVTKIEVNYANAGQSTKVRTLLHRLS